jgi:urease accessory protein
MNVASSVSSGWRAELRLQYQARGAQTILTRREHLGPLRVQRPFYPEPGRAASGACHTYIVHPPGGVVGGDELQIQVEVGDSAHAVLTTPAATKYYRSDGRQALQTQHFKVAAAAFEWLPQESIFHGGARVRSVTKVDLTSGSRFIGWEIPCLGLPARGERFDTGCLALDMELWRDGRPLFIDRLRLDGERVSQRAASDLAGHQAIGTMLVYPATGQLLEQVRGIGLDGKQFAATLVDGLLMCRALGGQAEQVKQAFIAVWCAVRPAMLGCTAVLPRIWAM